MTKRFIILAVLALAAAGAAVCGNGGGAGAAPTAVAGPLADHHQHLLSPAAVEHANDPPQAEVELPADLARLLRARERGWNDQAALAPLYTEDALVLGQDDWIRGRAEVAEYLSERYARAYRMTPVDFAVEGTAGYVAGYFTRGEGAAARHFGYFLLALRKGADGAWRVAAETPTFPGPRVLEPSTAEQLIEQLDEAGVRQAAVLSAAYWFGSPLMDPVPDERAKVRAENDWIAGQTARFPERLVAFCSFNPLEDYALDELGRCAADWRFRGVKLHFGNSDVDVRNPDHVERVRRVFRAANDRGLAIVAHLWTGPEYGREDAQVFLDRFLPAAPDVTVQIAHFAGGGPGYTDPALEVLAEAIAAGDPRTKNLYFDIATVADDQREETLREFARRIRQVGPRRVLFGTDLAPPNPPAKQAWARFRTTVPLTEEEFKTIAGNVAPYFASRTGGE